MFSEITTTRDIASAVWNMGVLDAIISAPQGNYIALIAEDGRVIEVTLGAESELILWTDYLNQEERDMAAYNDQGAVSLEDAEAFFTRWANL